MLYLYTTYLEVVLEQGLVLEKEEVQELADNFFVAVVFVAVVFVFLIDLLAYQY